MSQARLDFLTELGNIGAGHATTALSQMLSGQRLELVVPQAEMLSFDRVWEFIGGPEQVIVGIYILVSGDMSGHMAFLIPLDGAINLVGMLIMEDTEELDEMGLSALQEVGNIMVASYLNALSALTDMMLVPSVPGIAVDMAGAVWQSILAGANVADTITVVKTTFTIDSVDLEGHIIFLPEEEDFQKMTQAFGLEDLE